MSRTIGLILFVCGIFFLWKSVALPVIFQLDDQLYNVLYVATSYTVNAIIAIIAVIFGIKLIIGKKKEVLDNNAG
jgi:hypothetical protein